MSGKAEASGHPTVHAELADQKKGAYLLLDVVLDVDPQARVGRGPQQTMRVHDKVRQAGDGRAGHRHVGNTLPHAWLGARITGHCLTEKLGKGSEELSEGERGVVWRREYVHKKKSSGLERSRTFLATMAAGGSCA